MTKVKKATRKEKESVPIRDDLKIRVMEAKKALPPSGITSFFMQIYPEYDNTKGRSRLSNVLQTKSTDEDMTAKLEALVIMVQNEKNKQITT